MVNTLAPTPILFIDHATGLGGAEHSLLLLMEHLDSAAWQPHLACPDGELAKRARELAVPWQSISLPRLRRSWRFLQNWHYHASQLAKVAKELNASIVYANTVRAALYGAWAARLAKRPFIWHMRDFWLSETEPRFWQVDWAVKTALCRAATHVITNSAATASHLPCPSKTSVIYNGINPAHYAAATPGNFRQQHHIPAEAPLVGMVGRLRPWKGQHRFIEMAAAVAVAEPTAHFVIVGGSPFGDEDGYPAALRQQATAQQLDHRLHFTGHLADVRPALAALDLFVHPGDPEPFGLVNVEAMAVGKPVIAFDHGALPEIVLPGQTGLLIPPKDMAGLAGAVLTLLQNPKQRLRMGQAGQQRVQERFTIQQTAVQISTVLQKTVAGGR